MARTAQVIDASAPQPYMLRLPDGRHVWVELPPGSIIIDAEGEVAFRPEAIRTLDRARAMALEVPDPPSPGWIRTLREALGMTQAELGDKVGVDKLSVSRWERGRGRPGRLALTRLRRLRSRALQAGLPLIAAGTASRRRGSRR